MSAHDFDFLAGSWTVRHRRMKERLNGCTQWESFGGTSTLRQIMGGHGNVDDNVIELPAGSYRAASVRTYDSSTDQWAIWWIDGRTPHGPLDPGMRGRFENGIGTFFSDEAFDGRPIRVRFLWSGITASTARWEQAFSADGGSSWETNWVMDFERVAGPGV
jgi:hypothetical protein